MSGFNPSPQEWEILPENLTAHFEAESRPFRLIDCREQNEFEFCRLDRAELIPLSRFAELASGLLKDETRPIVIYCHHGVRSLQAAQFLRQQGITKTWSMAGGIDRWSIEINDNIDRY